MAEPRVTINHCATVLGLSWREARKIVRRLAYAYPEDEHGTYDARLLDLLRALRGLPHRELKPVESDWLSRYLKENHAATRTQGPGSARP